MASLATEQKDELCLNQQKQNINRRTGMLNLRPPDHLEDTTGLETTMGMGKGAMQQYRYWGHPSGDLTNGDFTLTVPITPEKWSDVYGAFGSEHPNGFNECVAKALVVGCTFGDPGQGAIGHGCYVKNGTARFTLKSFSIA